MLPFPVSKDSSLNHNSIGQTAQRHAEGNEQFCKGE